MKLVAPSSQRRRARKTLPAVAGTAVVVLLFFLARESERSEVPLDQEQREPLCKTMILVKTVPKSVAPVAAQSEAPVENDSESDAGRLIAIEADYRRHLGFPAYVEAMKRRGARFFIFDAGHDKLVAEVDLPGDYLSQIDPASLAHLSPRVREISGEIAVSTVLSKAEQELGAAYYRVIMLLPSSVEKRLDQTVRERLAKSGQDPDRVHRIEGEYITRNDQLCFNAQCYFADAGRQVWCSLIPF